MHRTMGRLDAISSDLSIQWLFCIFIGCICYGIGTNRDNFQWLLTPLFGMGDKITIECHRLSKTQREMVTRTKPNKNDLMSRTMVVLVRYKSLCIYRSLLNSAQQYEVRQIIFRIFIWTYWLSSGVTYSACASSETNRQRTEKTWSRITQFEGKILIQHFPGDVLEVVVVIALSSLFAGITTIKYIMYKDISLFTTLILWYFLSFR